MKEYDIIIIGGGISGLYIAYKLLKQKIKKRVLLLEGSSKLGGRIYTYNSKSWNSPIEAGAGRFHKGHVRLFKLIKDLDLDKNIKSIGNAHLRHISQGVEINQNVNTLVKRIITRAKNVPIEILRETNIINFVKKREILTEEELTHLIGFYGYYSELDIMNAYDAIELFKNGTNPENDFFVMRGGGLSQIVREMENAIENSNLAEETPIRILKNKSVLNVRRDGDGGGGDFTTPSAPQNFEIIVKCRDGTEYCCEKCILAMPKPCFEKFSIVRETAAENVDFYRSINSVVCSPLCRIYSYYDDTRNRWIKEQIHNKFNGKLTSDSVLRFIIPVNDNIIMTSYTDNVFAKWWKKKYDKGGIASINREVTMLLRELFNTKHIPVANKTQIFYWDCGVGYWKIGANSKKAAETVLRGGGDVRENLFICGENYSEKYQQWIEGAIETADNVLEILHP